MKRSSLSALQTIAFLGLTVSFPAFSHAWETTWQNPDDGSWSNINNWSHGLPGVSGSAVIDNAATVLASGGGYAFYDQLLIGDEHEGGLELSSVRLTGTTATLGNRSDSVGHATLISGTWSNAKTLYIGRSGTGVLTINGGKLETTQSVLGDFIGGHGSVTITSGTWTHTEDLIIGKNGTGALEISGGEVVSGYAYIGEMATGIGSAVVTGGTWNTSGLSVGDSGTGELEVDGGLVQSTSGFLGNRVGSHGSATVNSGTWKSDTLYVGHDGTGTLTVAEGGVVTTETLFASLSDLQGSGIIETKGGVLDADLTFDATHGLVQTLSFGSGGELQADWTEPSVFGVGYHGNGSLTIDDGVTLESSTGFLGYHAGSHGTATVTSGTWSNTGSLFVGYQGTGDLTVGEEGTVSTTTLYASLNHLHGSGVIEANGAVLDGTLVFDETHGLQQTIAFGSGGELQLDVNGNGALGAGYQEVGVLRITDEMTVSSRIGYFGSRVGSSGTGIITSGTWYNSGSLFVGVAGEGHLQIDSGLVTSAAGWVGVEATGEGHVSVTSGTWKSTGGVHIGSGGTGTLDIDEGYVESGSTLTDATYVGAGEGSVGSVTITSGTWQNTGELYIGQLGQGSVTITDGLFDQRLGNSYIGQNAYGSFEGAVGTVTVTSGTWQNGGDLYIASGEDHSLTVTDGKVTAKTLFASQDNLHGNGVIETKGAVLDADFYFESNTGQSVYFGDGGLIQIDVNGEGALGVGYEHTGTLFIGNGAEIVSAAGYFGYNEGSEGTGIVSLGTWVNTGALRVGHSGTGTLDITSGLVQSGPEVVTGGYSPEYGFVDEMSTPSGIIAGGAWSKGEVTIVSGTWQNGGALVVGDGGEGTLTVQGGLVSSEAGTIVQGGNTTYTASGYIAREAGSTGAVTITSGTWSNGGDLHIGHGGTGSLTLESGLVENENSYVGYRSGGVGDVLINGGAWLNHGTLTIGRDGEGSVKVVGNADGRGTISAENIVVNPNTGQLEVDGGIILAEGHHGNFIESYGSGVQIGKEGLFINSNGFNIHVSSYLTGEGGLSKTGEGNLTLSAANDYLGSTTITGGSLTVAHSQALGSNEVVVRNGGTLLIESGVTLANKITLGNDGNLSQQIGASQSFTVARIATADVAHKDISAEFLDGTASASVILTTGFSSTSSAGNDHLRHGAVLHLSGIPVVDAGTGETDLFVLQINLGGINENAYLGWLDTSTNEWVNAVEGNIGGTGFFVGDRAYNAETDFVLGYYGIDTENGALWAVLNHNSDFAVVPEPGTWVFLGVGAAAFAALRRKRLSA